MSRVVVAVVLVIFSSVLFYGAFASHGTHDSGCLSTLAFSLPCLSSSLEQHFELFLFFTLVLPVLLLILATLLSLFSRLRLREQVWEGLSFFEWPTRSFDKFRAWLSFLTHSPTRI